MSNYVGMATYGLLVVLLVQGVWVQVCLCGKDQEERLIRDLLRSYNRRARPVNDVSHVVTVVFEMALNQLMTVDEKNEVITTHAWIRQYWNDSRLSWNNTQYNGINELAIQPTRLWLPDISLLNSATENMGLNGDEMQLTVQSSGEITWINPAILKSSCNMDITYFPLDDQLCQIRFGSWSYALQYLNVVPRKVTADLNGYAENGEWILMNANAYRVVYQSTCCEDKYPEVSYNLSLRRRTLFYMMNFILPCILIAVLTLLVFLLPSESGERMSFGVTVLLSFTILILMLMAKLPATSKVIPLIAIYYACTMIEVSTAMFLACLMMRFYHPEHPDAPLPRWVKVVIMHYCARLVGLYTSVGRVRQELVVQDLRQVKLRENHLAANTKMNTLTEHIFKKEAREARKEEWRMAAIIINRLFAWIYLVTIITTFLAVMLQAPRFREGKL